MNAAVLDMDPAGVDDQNEAANDGDAGESKSYTWNADTLQAIKSYSNTVDEVNATREAANAKLAAAKTALVDKGFNRDALKAALSYANTPEDKRKAWDESYIFARRALGVPIQEDLFAAAMRDEVTVEGK